MGRGIAQLCAQAGLTTLLFDSNSDAVKQAIAATDKSLEGLVSKGRMTAEIKKDVLGRLKPISTYDECARAGIVIEAIVEDISAKRSLFRELDQRVAANAVLATNTSSLSVTEVAAGCAQPQRVAGLHFFNPPPSMKLVEVIGGLRTESGVVEALVEFARRIGKHAIVAADSPGFVVNHAGRAYGPEALRIVAQGIASPQEVDVLMKEAAGFRMGPFELLDLVGGDVTHAVMVSIFEQFFDEPMYQPSTQMAVRVAGGLLGRKSKRGFYSYEGMPAKDKPTVPVPPGAKPAAAWVANEDGGAELAEWLKGAGVKIQFGGTPAAGIPGFVAPRLLAMIVNIGTRIAELRIATPSDIDTAVELGLNYPKGPLALGDVLGPGRVLAVLDGMQAITHDPKYRATTWLRRRARLGVSLHTPD